MRRQPAATHLCKDSAKVLNELGSGIVTAVGVRVSLPNFEDHSWRAPPYEEDCCCASYLCPSCWCHPALLDLGGGMQEEVCQRSQSSLKSTIRRGNRVTMGCQLLPWKGEACTMSGRASPKSLH